MVAHRRIGPDGGFLREFTDVRKRVQSLETRPSGVIATREMFIVTDPETGVKTIMGKLPDGSTGFQPFVGDIVPPPVASAPTATAQPGTITVTWDGTFVGGAEQPADFEHLNVMAHKVLTGSTVLTLEVGSIRLANESVVITSDIISYGEQWQFSFESEDYNGNISVRSARTPLIDVVSYVDDSLVGEALSDLAAASQTAQEAAQAAQEAAQAAQDDADAAAASALAASNLADSKGKVYTRSTAPSADYSGLWIDTAHNNVPRRYLGVRSALVVNAGGGASIQSRLSAKGWAVSAVTTVPSFEDSVKYDLVAMDAGYAGLGTSHANLATKLYDRGVSLYTSGNDTTSLPPLFTGAGSRGTTKNSIQSTNNVLGITYSSYADSDLNYYLTGVNSAAVVTGTTLVTSLGTDQPLNLVLEHPTNFSRWVHIETYATPAAVIDLHLDWLSNNWVAIQDQGVISAASAAASAQIRADQAFNNAASAATAAGDAQISADGKNAIWYQDDAPAGTGHKVGDTWFDTNDNYKIRTWNGSIWQTTQDSWLAQQTADSKGITYTQNTVPPVEARLPQNLWNDTSLGLDKVVVKYWSTTAGAWTALADKAATEARVVADSKGETIYSSTTPAVSAQLTQNLWVDTTGGINIHKRWVQGSGWVVVADTRIASSAAAVTAADAKAQTALNDSATKSIVYTQATTPPVSARLPQTLWNDTSLGVNNIVVKYWDTVGLAWTALADKAATDAALLAGSKSKVVYSNTAPTGADANVLTLWIDTTGGANTPKKWVSGTTWTGVSDKVATDAAALAASKGEVIYSDTAPIAAKQLAQNLWVDTTGGLNLQKRWSGSAWVVVADSRIAQSVSDISALTSQVSAVSAQADRSITTFYGTTTPVSPEAGDLWLDGTAGVPMKRYSGSAWVVFEDPNVQAAYTKAGDAQAAADAKVRTWAQDTEPTGMVPNDVGDLWIDTNDNNKMWRYSGAAWVALQDGDIAVAQEKADTAYFTASSAVTAAQGAQTTADGKNTIYYQTTQPSGGTYKIGDLWFDTDDSYKLRTFAGGTTWTVTQDSAGALTAATAASNSASAAMTAANGKNKVIHSTSAATGTTGYSAGDTWFQRDASGYVIAMWEFTTSWQVRAIGNDVLAANINAGKVTAGTLSADRIGANTIGASKLIVGDMEEIIPNPFFHPSGEPVQAAAGTIITTASSEVSAGAPYPYALKIQARDNHPFATPNIAVRPGDQFYMEAWVRAAPTTTRAFNFYIFGSTQPVGGLSAKFASGQAVTTTWTKKTYSFTVPLNATYTYIRPVLQVETVGGDTADKWMWYVTGWSMRRKNGGELIVDGAIKAGSAIIENAAIDAAKIASVDAGTITVGQLKGWQIEANAIDASKLNVSLGGSNLVANSSFEADTDANGLSDGWAVWTRGTGDAGRVFTCTRPAGHFPGSTFAQRVTSTTVTNTESSSIQATTLFSISASTSAAFSLYGRASVAGNYGVSIRCENDAGGYMGDASFTAAFTTTAQRFSGVVITPAGTTKGKVTITSPTSLTNGHWFEVDGIQVQLGNVGSSWGPMTEELLPGTIKAGMLAADSVLATNVSASALNGKIITGSTVQTEATASRGIKLTSTELAGYDASGNKNFSLTSSGALTVKGNIKSGSTIEGATITGTSGLETSASANTGVKVTNSGIKAYDSGNNLSFYLDATTGKLEVPGLKANSIDGDMIKGGTVTAKNLFVGDMANLATIDELNGITVTSFGQTQIVAGYNKLVTDSGAYLMFTEKHGPVPFSEGDTLYYEFTAKATAPTTAQFAIYTYDAADANSASFTSDLAIGTTDTLIKGEKVVTAYRANATQFVVGLLGVANKGIQVKGVKVYKKFGGQLIVDGAIDGKVITGPTIQTDTGATTGIKLTPTELAGWDGTNKNFSLTSAGDLTLKGNIKSGSTIEGARITGTSGLETSTSLNTGVKVTNSGIKAYDAGSNLSFHLDAATGYLEVPGIKTNSLKGDTIESGTILAEKMLIANSSNVIVDPAFFNPTLSAYRTSVSAGGTAGWTLNTGTATTMRYYSRTTASTNDQFHFITSPITAGTSQNHIQVSDGQKWSFSVDVETNVTAVLRWNLYLFKSDGSTQYWGLPWNATATGKRKLTGEYTVPTGVVAIAPAIASNTSGVLWKVYGNAYAGIQANSTLIENGAVTTNHMTAGTIDGGIITAGTLKATKLEAKSVGIDQLTISSSDNMIVESAFEAVATPGVNWTRGANQIMQIGGGRNGGNAMRLTGTTSINYTYNLNNKVTVDDDNRFKVSMWVKSNVALVSDRIRVGVKPYKGSTALANVSIFKNSSNSASANYLPGGDVWTQISGVTDPLPAGTTQVEWYINVSAPSTTAYFDIDSLSVTRANDGTLIVDGAITAKKMESELVLATKIVAGDPLGTHAEMSPEGFKVYARNLSATGGPPTEAVRLGVANDDDYFAITKSDGKYAASISQEGIGSFSSLYTLKATTIGASSTTTSGGFYYNGKEFSNILDERPRGVIAAAYRDTFSGYNATIGGPFQPYLRLEATLEPGRMYKIWTSPIRVNTDLGVGCTVSIAFNNTTFATVDNSNHFTQAFVQPNSNGGRDSVTIQELFSPIGVTVPTVYSFIMAFGIQEAAGGATGQAGLRGSGPHPVRLVVEDVGPNNGNIGSGVSLDGTVPPPPPKNNYVKQYGCTNSMNYQTSGAQYPFDTGRMYQGLSPAGYGNLGSIALFDRAAIQADLSGATVNYVRVYFNFQHWYYNSGGTARIGVHSHTGIPGTWSALGPLSAISGGWPKPGARWVDLSSSHWEGFKNGYGGVYLEGDTSYNTYGYTDRPTLEIGYNK